MEPEEEQQPSSEDEVQLPSDDDADANGLNDVDWDWTGRACPTRATSGVMGGGQAQVRCGRRRDNGSRAHVDAQAPRALATARAAPMPCQGARRWVAVRAVPARTIDPKP